MFLVFWRLLHLFGRHTWTLGASVQMDEAGIITEVTTRIECVICGEPKEKNDGSTDD